MFKLFKTKTKAKDFLNRYKRRAPKVPDYTCTDIDNVIERLEKLSENRKILSKLGLKVLVRKLERLRASNESLRDSGIYWYRLVKNLIGLDK